MLLSVMIICERNICIENEIFIIYVIRSLEQFITRNKNSRLMNRNAHFVISFINFSGISRPNRTHEGKNRVLFLAT